ncbi:MAG: hypothetical protein KTR24_10360 [Saprospiraceae bacterium]|nr:hypothetical protein [Saprospiraceae bacterium]
MTCSILILPAKETYPALLLGNGQNEIVFVEYDNTDKWVLLVVEGP